MKHISLIAIFFHLSYQVIVVDAQAFPILDCFTPCANGYTGNEVIPGTGCKYYHECWKGKVRSRTECGDPLIYDETKNYCNFPSEVECLLGPEYVVCPDSISPTRSPIIMSNNETSNITISLSTQSPSIQPTTQAPTIYGNALDHVKSKRGLIEEFVLVSYKNNDYGNGYSSTQYTFDGMIQALQQMAVDGFGADFKFDLWEGNGDLYIYGLVNLAAFLANAMVESIEDDTCDEISWQETSGRYAISNSCGQQKRSYQDETCNMKDDIFSCEVKPEMVITAVTMSADDRAPPALQCKPKSGQYDYTGYWDSNSATLFTNSAYSNSLGRTDIEGCCWFGRGAIMTKGVCNMGKLNYYLGKRGADSGRSTLYPTIDFCDNPEAPCNSVETENMRWTIALFEWAERVQRYYNKPDEWNFNDQLTQFVDTGMTDDTFINSVSRILSSDCHEPGCSYFEPQNLDKRRSNFYLIINDIFQIRTLLDDLTPTPLPTMPLPFVSEQPTVQVVTPPQRPQPKPSIGYVSTQLPTYDGQLISLEGNGINREHNVGLVYLLSLSVLVIYCNSRIIN